MPKQTFFNLPDEKREHIINIAVDEFAAHGYKGASISRMVAAAGIAKGSFYQYFEDKDDLYAHLVGSLIADRKLQAFQEEMEKLKVLSLTQFLRLVFHRQVREFMERPKLMKIALEIMQLTDQPIYRKIMGRYQEDYNTYFIPFIRHEVQQGEIDNRVNIHLLNFMLVSLGQYMIYRFTTENRQDISNEMIDEIVDDLEFIFINGIYTDASSR